MKHLLLFCVSFRMITLLCGQSSAQEVLKIEKQRFTAMVNNDTSYLNRILADSLLYVHTDGNVDSKQSLLNALANGDLDYKQMELKEVTYKVYDKTIILSGTMNVMVFSKKAGKTLDLNIRYLDVYQYNYSGWQLIAWQSSKLN
jgi:hypothetical protein